jgi:O-acetylserine/cysteine efflux transporter
VRPLHIAASLLIAATWGLNFTMIRFGLDEFEPFAFAAGASCWGACRCWCCRARRSRGRRWSAPASSCSPASSCFLFFAMQAGLPPGLPRCWSSCRAAHPGAGRAVPARARDAGQWAGLAVAMVGVVLIARSVEGSASLLAVGDRAAVGAELGAGNLFLRETARLGARRSRPGRASCRRCRCCWQPVHDGVDGDACADSRADAGAAGSCCFYTVVPVMWLGYLMWGTLLRSYPAGKVGPVSLLVPCCALVFSSLLTGESIGGLRLVGVAVVLGGVALGIFTFAAGR